MIIGTLLYTRNKMFVFVCHISSCTYLNVDDNPLQEKKHICCGACRDVNTLTKPHKALFQKQVSSAAMLNTLLFLVNQDL